MLSSIACMICGALLLDLLLGDPPNSLHPVCLIGWYATKVEALFRRVGSSRLIGGFAYLCTVLLPMLLLSAVAIVIEHWIGSWGVTLWAGVLLWLFFAPAGLAKHARVVQQDLADNTLEVAQKSVGMLVGRKTDQLDSPGVARAAIESVAENFTDGVASPLFWSAVGFMICGPLGAVMLVTLYRVTNTLDSMWGHKNERYRTFGTVAARMDDLLNCIPARLGYISSSLASLMPSFCARKAWHMGMRDGRKHESPNAGWTEATFAGALGLQLNGPVVYGDTVVEHPWVGEGTQKAIGTDIKRAIWLMWLSCLVFIALLLGIAYMIEEIL